MSETKIYAMYRCRLCNKVFQGRELPGVPDHQYTQGTTAQHQCSRVMTGVGYYAGIMRVPAPPGGQPQ